MAESPHVAAADAAWAAAKRRFLVPETEWLADFLGADGFAGLPTPDEVRRAIPDRCTGFGLFHLFEALWRGFCQGSALPGHRFAHLTRARGVW